MKELIKTIIADFHKGGIPQFKKRDLDMPINSGKIVTLIGPRRAGKTYTMFGLMSKIKDITDIVYINFEDERLTIKAEELNKIIESYFELYPNKKKIYFFFDEIQEIPGWEKFIRRVYDTISKDIFITGSSSKLLSKEIAASLRGRTLTYNIFPLSFKEYLNFKGIEKEIHSTRGKAKIFSEYEKYMEKGGFPETIEKEPDFIDKILQSYFEVMLYRDLIERYRITNHIALKFFIKKLIANTARGFSIHKIFNELKSQGVKISKDHLYDFLSYCEDAFILLPVSVFSESLQKQILKKSYSIDVGLSQILSFSLSKDKGRILENIVMLELKRKEKEIYFFKEKHECDFIIKQKDKIIEVLQVCTSINEENREREIGGLKEAMKRFKLKKGVILTIDQEDRIGNIEIIPVWKWLLS
ncbi:MAG: ATP-binding protein [Nanoarchaeota archaeon]|nr:ATP-binding protein [Nanoarchaeota archaeon]